MGLSPLRLRVAAALALALALVASAAARADTPKTLDPAALVPTQATLGYEVAKDNLRKWEAQARKKGLSLREYAREVLVPKMAKKKTPVIIDPDGRVRNADGHHRVWALQTLQRELGMKIEVRLQVLRDYRGTSHEEYAADLVKLLRLRVPEGQSPQEAIEALPPSYAQLKDSPMRSLVGKAFKRAGLKGKWFKPYVQFDVANRLMAEGLLGRLKEKRLIPAGAREVPASAASDPQVLSEVQTMMLESKEVRRLLEKKARSKKTEKVKKKVKKARRSAGSSRRGYTRRLKTRSSGRTGSPRRGSYHPRNQARLKKARKGRTHLRARAR